MYEAGKGKGEQKKRKEPIFRGPLFIHFKASIA